MELDVPRTRRRRRALPPFPEAPSPPPAVRVSIIVNNHDYERYVGAAIDSALEQRCVEVEVIVVDDGSTDGSRDVIGGYGDRVRVLLQDNLGQRSAFNAGFSASTGDLVMFLDADDVLAPGIVAAVAQAMAHQPDAARVVFRLSLVDEAGHPSDVQVPPVAQHLPDGDVREQVLAFPDDLAWPPTSGNAFASWVLRRVMPLSLDDDRTGADHDLHTLTPLFGPVVALPQVGGGYRVHAHNAHARQQFDLDRSRLILRRTQRSHVALVDLARQLGHATPRPRSVTTAAHRVVSLRSGPGHPLPGDSLRRAVAAGIAASWGRFDVGLGRRIAYSAWFLAAAMSPRWIMRRLADVGLRATQPPSTS